METEINYKISIFVFRPWGRGGGGGVGNGLDTPKTVK